MEYENQPCEQIDRTALKARVEALAKDGYRLVQICCTTSEIYEITYSFDKEYQLLNLRLQLTKEDTALPSITDQFLAAFTYENELQDLFGLKVEGMQLNFNGNFYKLSEKTPFATAAPVKKPVQPQPGAGA